MNRPYLLVAACVLLMGAEEASKWEVYWSPERTFKVRLPANPEEDKAPAGMEKAHVVSATIKGDGELVLMVISAEMAGVPRSRPEAKRFVQGMEHGFFEAAKAKVVSSTEITLGDVPGREALAEGFKGKWVRYRGYAVGKHVYQVVAYSDDRAPLYSEDATRFFGSFQILDLPNVPFEEGDTGHELGRKAGKAVGIMIMILLVVGFVFRGLRKQSGA